jgi:ribosomal protein L9
MDCSQFNESLSLEDGLFQPPSMAKMLCSIRNLSSALLGDKYNTLDQLWEASHREAVLPGLSSKDLAKMGTKPEICDLLEDACGLIFCELLPGLKRIYLDAKQKTEVPVKKNFPEPSGELVELQREVIRLQKEVIQLKEELHSAEKSAFSTTMRKELKSYSAVLSQNCAAAVAPRRLQTALKKATTPVEPETDRSKNIMVFGLPEADNEEETATREAVMKVLAHLEVSPSVTSSVRVGTKTSVRPRPIKVSVEKREDLLILLKKARLLRQTSSFRTVYLSPDLTKEEREDSTRLYKTVKQLRLDNPGRKYWVRGGSIMFDV